MNSCLLCQDTSSIILELDPQFYRCGNCGSVFRHPRYLPTPEAEKERYITHNNDVEDPGYQNFVSPIIGAVCEYFPESSIGLDFGAGTGPVIAKLLEDKGYVIQLWDPFFHPNPEVLVQHYDFIVCCEVIEHFHTPIAEFQLMKRLLKPGGKLFCMTHLLTKETSFADWYYKDDHTHVIFYSEENVHWIKEDIGFSEVTIEGRLVVFSN